jgi:hypothetical protein
MKLHYMELLCALFDAGLIPQGEASEPRILHDDNCPILAGVRHCNCDPEVRINGKSYLYSKYCLLTTKN